MKVLKFIVTVVILINIITVFIILHNITSPVERVVDCKHHHITHDEITDIIDSVIDSKTTFKSYTSLQIGDYSK